MPPFHPSSETWPDPSGIQHYRSASRRELKCRWRDARPDGLINDGWIDGGTERERGAEPSSCAQICLAALQCGGQLAGAVAALASEQAVSAAALRQGPYYSGSTSIRPRTGPGTSSRCVVPTVKFLQGLAVLASFPWIQSARLPGLLQYLMLRY